MTSLLLATVVAMRLAGAPQTFEFQAEAGKAYHIAVTSHCSCYYPQPRVVVPEVEILDASGSRIARPTSDLRGTSRGTANYDIASELTFTAPADGTYVVRVTPAHVDGYVAAIAERFSSTGFGGKVVASSESLGWTPIAASQSGRVTITIE